MTGMPVVRRGITHRHLLRPVRGAVTAASLASAWALVSETKYPSGELATPARIRLGYFTTPVSRSRAISASP